MTASQAQSDEQHHGRDEGAHHDVLQTPAYRSTSCQFAPSWYPAVTNSDSQIRLPSAVSPRNVVSRIRFTPAGVFDKLGLDDTDGINRRVAVVRYLDG